MKSGMFYKVVCFIAMNKPQVLYKDKLAKEWIDWVESENPEGSREKEIYPLIRKWVEINNARIIVDIGCGQGICSSFVSSKIDYIGIDLSKELIKRARKLYKSANRQFLVGSAYDIPLGNNFSDSVISIWVWSHLANLEKAAKEIYRILKSGGKFLLITANPDTYDIRKTFYKTFGEYEGYLVGTFDLGNGKTLTDTTLYLHTEETMIKAIEKSKLVIDKIETIGLEDTYSRGLNILIEGHKPK